MLGASVQIGDDYIMPDINFPTKITDICIKKEAIYKIAGDLTC